MDNGGGLVDAGGAVLADPVAERALIGRILAEPGLAHEVCQEIKADCFFDPVNRMIFKAFETAVADGWPIQIGEVVAMIGGDPKQIVAGDQTLGQYLASAMSDADMQFDAVELAAELFAAAERRAIDETNTATSLELNAPFVSRMGLRMWADQNDPGETVEYLVEDLIPERSGVLIMGESQTGKSFLTSHLALCGARAVPFFGRRILKPFGTVWCAYEAGNGQTARMRAYAKFHGLNGAIEDLPFGVLTKPIPLWPDQKAIDETIAEIKGVARACFNGVPLGMAVFDTYNTATPGASEIDSETVSRIRLGFDRIREELDATVVLVGHTNASGKHRGNEQLYNNIGTVITVARKVRQGSGRDVFELKDEDGLPLRTWRVKKQREGQEGEEADFVLRVVPDGTMNKFGKQRTSCVVASPRITEMDGSADARPRTDDDKHLGVKVNRSEAVFLKALLDALDESGIAAPAELGLDVGTRVVDYDVVKRLILNRTLREEDNTEDGRKKHRNRIRVSNQRSRIWLENTGVIGCHTPYIWWTGKPVRGIARTQPKERDLFASPHPDDEDVNEFF